MSQIKQQKENQIKLKKYLFDLEKEYRNLTDTRIALEIKHETLNPQNFIFSNSSSSISNNNNVVVAAATAAVTTAQSHTISPLALASSYI